MTEHERPNVVLILVDDMGYGDFAAFNYGRSRTPVLDELMREGTLLTQHYSASPICAPARAALMSGRYPHRTGAIETRELRGLCNMALCETTIGDLFKRAGYATGLIGKWHNGGVRPEFHPNRRGFDEFVGFCSGWQDYYGWILDRNGSFEKADGRYLTDVLTEEAVAFIRRHQREPFLLNVCYNAPHTPLQAPADAVRPFAETGAHTMAVSTIYGMISVMDAGVGRILETLAQLGLANNTIVMFTSDNGPQFGGRGEACTTRFNCGFSGSKSFVYEGGIRVPMILRWPAGLEGRRSVHEMVHFCDWLPTLLGAAGVEVPRELALDGCDVLPVLRGEPGDVPTRRFWQWNRYRPEVTSNAAMRDGDWKLVRPPIKETFWTDPEEQKLDTAYRDEPWREFEPITGDFPARTLPEPPLPELYNIAADPLERRDLAADHPARVSRMLRDLEDWFEDVEADRAAAGGPW